MLTRRLKKLTEGQQAQTFGRWSRWVHEVKLERVLLARRAVARGRRIRRWAVVAWRAHVDERARLAQKARECMARLSNLGLGVAWAAWVSYHEQKAMLRRRAAGKTLSQTEYYFHQWFQVVVNRASPLVSSLRAIIGSGVFLGLGFQFDDYENVLIY